jgi:hypothetical protein
MIKRCTGWHAVGRDENGEPVIEWRQWYTYDDSPCPEHGREFLVTDPGH